MTANVLLTWFDLVGIRAPMIEIVQESPHGAALSVRVYSETHTYVFGACMVGHASLGCTALTRKPRPGEVFNQVTDLTTGPFTLDTFYQILADIVRHELLPIERPGTASGRAPLLGTAQPATDLLTRRVTV